MVKSCNNPAQPPLHARFSASPDCRLSSPVPGLVKPTLGKRSVFPIFLCVVCPPLRGTSESVVRGHGLGEGTAGLQSTRQAKLEPRYYNPAQVNPLPGGWIVWGIINSWKLSKHGGVKPRIRGKILIIVGLIRRVNAWKNG